MPRSGHVAGITLVLDEADVQCESAARTLKGAKGSTLVVPAVSFGNVGQLATDLLLQTMRAQRVAYLRCRHIVPMVGNDAFDMGEPGVLVTPLELFRLTAHPKVFVIQQRSPVLKGRLDAYAEDIVAWAKASGFSRIVVLASGDANERTAGQIEGSQLWFAYAGKGTETDYLPSKGEWRQLKPRDTPWQNETGTGEWLIPGSGVAMLIRNKIDKDEGELECFIILRFCNEGDNTGDAHSLASKANELLQLEAEPVNWQAPVSWRHLFGSLKQTGLY